MRGGERGAGDGTGGGDDGLTGSTSCSCGITSGADLRVTSGSGVMVEGAVTTLPWGDGEAGLTVWRGEGGSEAGGVWRDQEEEGTIGGGFSELMVGFGGHSRLPSPVA